jgi:hypothetical protein
MMKLLTEAPWNDDTTPPKYNLLEPSHVQPL